MSDSKQQKTFYFAYGSNNPKQMEERIGKTLTFEGIGTLDDYKFTYQGRSDKWHCGTANISPLRGNLVYGILYSGMTLEDFDILDQFEAVQFDVLGNNIGRYKRVKLKVFQEESKQIVEAICYVMTGYKPIDRQIYPPSNKYLKACLKTAQIADFPLTYIVEHMIPEYVLDPLPAPGYSFKNLT